MKAHGGVVTAADFAGYHLRFREPLVSTYRGYTIVGVPAAEFRRRPRRADPQHPGELRPQARNLAPTPPPHARHGRGDEARLRRPRLLARRPRFRQGAPRPADKDYARTLAARIDPHLAIDVPGHGQPPGPTPTSSARRRSPATERSSGEQAHHARRRRRRRGQLGRPAPRRSTRPSAPRSSSPAPASCSTTRWTISPCSRARPTPSAWSAADANAVAPGKRPLSSMSPTIVLEGGPAPAGRPVLALGAAGGPTIISEVVQVIVNRLDLGMPLPQAVAAPRIHHQWRPDVLYVEPGVAAAAVEELEAARPQGRAPRRHRHRPSAAGPGRRAPRRRPRPPRAGRRGGRRTTERLHFNNGCGNHGQPNADHQPPSFRRSSGADIRCS